MTSFSEKRPAHLILASLLSCFLVGPALQSQSPSSASDKGIEALMQSGAAALHQGNAAEAENDFRRATAAAPEMPDAYLYLGLAELREGKADGAETDLSKAIQLNPELPGAHMFLGIAQFQMNKLDAAISSLKLEQTRQPDNVEVLTWLGIAELGAGHADEAVAPLDRAAQLSPKDPNVLDYRGRAHSLVAQQSYRALTALDPDSWRVHRALGEVSAESKDWPSALAEYQKAIDRQPNNADLYEALGDTYQRLHRTDDASRAYESELKLSPHSSIALYNLGRIQVERGDAQAGVTLLRQAADASAPSAQISLYLGRGLADTGHPQEASTWLEKCLDEQPTDFIKQDAYFQLARVYKALNRNEDAKHAADELQKLKTAAAKSGATDDPR
jgi:tetratricopeptide (TPR) repeat protein